MRTAFFGTPDFAVGTLRALHEISDVQVVICQPDKPAGRGMKLKKPPTKVFAEEHGIEVWQPTKVRKGDLAERLEALNLDVAVVVAYGRILPKKVLDAPKHGCINVHASLLPKLRGAAPIQWSIVRGEKESGVTLMQMDEGLDTGPMLSVSKVEISENMNAAELHDALASSGADLLRADLKKILDGEIKPQAQDDAASTYAPMLKKTDGLIDWSKSAQEIHDQVRGLTPWPGAYSERDGKRVKVHRTTMSSRRDSNQAGSIVGKEGDAICIVAGDGVVLQLEEVQPANRKRISGAAFFAGLQDRDVGFG